MKFTIEEALEVAGKLGIDFKNAGFTPEEFLEGMNIELEHGTADPKTNVTDDDPIVTGKIALAHLNEAPRYYDENIGIEAWEHAIEKLDGNSKARRIIIE